MARKLSAIILILLLCTPFVIFANSIKGRTIDSKLSTPLVGMTCKVEVNGQIFGAKSDAKGYFAIKDLPIGRHSLIVSGIGYQPQKIDNIMMTSGKEIVIEIKLDESYYKTDDVLVLADRDAFAANNELVAISYSNISTEMINRFAGSRQDPAKIASNMAGVASNDNRRNDIIVRGNSPLSVLWKIEDVDISNPNHFTVAATGGGVFSILNNNVISNCDFITGAFPAEYGNKTGGVFDVKLRNGNPDRAEHTFQIGLNGLEFGSEGPLPFSDKSSYIVNARLMSFKPITALGVDIKLTTVPEYYDASFKINIPTEKFGQFTIWGLGGYSKASVKNSEEEGIAWEQTDNVEDENLRSSLYAFAVSNTHFCGDNSFGKVTLSTNSNIIHTFNEYVFKDKSTMPSENYDGTEGTHQLAYTFNYKLNKQNFFKIGGTYKYQYIDNYFKEYSNQAKVYETKMDYESNTYLLQSYINWQYKMFEFLTFNSGIYYQYYALNDKASLEPRITANINISDNQQFSLGYGKHSQTHPLLYYIYKFYSNVSNGNMNNFNLDFTKADHYVVGYSRTIGNDFHLKLEGFYQDLYSIPVSKESWAPDYSFVNLGAEFSFFPIDSCYNFGKGKNYGIELTFEKQFSNNWYAMITGTLYKSKYTGGDGQWRSTVFDLGYIVNILGGLEVFIDAAKRNTFTLDFKVSAMGGRRVIPINMELSKLYGDEILNRKDAYSEQLNPFFQADIKLGLNFNLENTTHSVFIAADNFLNSSNVIDKNWSDTKNRVEYEELLGFFPYLGYKINF